MNDNFGFNESRGSVTSLNTKPGSEKHGLYSNFRCDKPYRLAFYWQPSLKRRRLDATTLSKSIMQKTNESLTITKNLSLENSNVSSEAEVTKPTARKKNTKINNKENEGRSNKTQTTSKKKGATLFEGENTSAVEVRQSGRLKELNGKTSQKTNAKIQKSTVRFMESESCNENQEDLFNIKKACTTFSRKKNAKEPTVVEHEETIEVKKRPSVTYTRNKSKPKEPARTKQKDTTTTKTKNKMPKAEQEEFEKWAASLNKEFDEVENFDLSVNYD